MKVNRDNHLYADGSIVEFGDVCEFDHELGEWDKKLEARREYCLEGEVTKLLPKGKIRIRWEDESDRTKQGNTRIRFAVREASQCQLARRSM